MTFPSQNLAVVAGALSSPPKRRALPSGDELVQLEITTRPVGAAAASSVPVSVAPAIAGRAELDQLDVGEEVVVIGHVRRRFFRAGGVTQSRTEVVATHVIPSRKQAAASRAVAKAVAILTGP